MAVSRVALYCVELEDKPGTLHRFLSQSSLSGVDYLCFVVFSCGNNRSRLVVSPKDMKKFKAFAKEAKLKPSPKAGFIFEGEDRIGAAADAVKGLAENDVAGFVGAAIASQGCFRMLIVVDPKDADRAQKALWI